MKNRHHAFVVNGDSPAAAATSGQILDLVLLHHVGVDLVPAASFPRSTGGAFNRSGIRSKLVASSYLSFGAVHTSSADLFLPPTMISRVTSIFSMSYL